MAVCTASQHSNTPSLGGLEGQLPGDATLSAVSWANGKFVGQATVAMDRTVWSRV